VVLTALQYMASKSFDAIDHLTLLSKLPTGERTYQVFRTGLMNAARIPNLTVTIAPNLAAATVEWSRGKSRHETGYRTFRIQGLIIQPEETK